MVQSESDVGGIPRGRVLAVLCVVLCVLVAGCERGGPGPEPAVALSGEQVLLTRMLLGPGDFEGAGPVVEDAFPWYVDGTGDYRQAAGTSLNIATDDADVARYFSIRSGEIRVDLALFWLQYGSAAQAAERVAQVQVGIEQGFDTPPNAPAVLMEPLVGLGPGQAGFSRQGDLIEYSRTGEPDARSLEQLWQATGSIVVKVEVQVLEPGASAPDVQVLMVDQVEKIEAVLAEQDA